MKVQPFFFNTLVKLNSNQKFLLCVLCVFARHKNQTNLRPYFHTNLTLPQSR
jgi:hypothetical protein